MPTRDAVERPPALAAISAWSRGEPLGLHRLRHLVHRRRGGRSRPRAVLEGEGRGVADLVDDGERVGEICLGLAGEADDEVAGERDVGPRRANPVDDAADSRPGCAAGSSPRAPGRSPDCTGRCR